MRKRALSQLSDKTGGVASSESERESTVLVLATSIYIQSFHRERLVVSA